MPVAELTQPGRHRVRCGPTSVGLIEAPYAVIPCRRRGAPHERGGRWLVTAAASSREGALTWPPTAVLRPARQHNPRRAAHGLRSSVHPVTTLPTRRARVLGISSRAEEAARAWIDVGFETGVGQPP